jgi:hypothetical protein
VGASAAGALTYTPAAGTLLNAGDGQALIVDAAATANYNAATATVHINVNKAEQTITWADPLDITYGTLLDGTQLNATVEGVSGASAAGTLTYSPAAGTLLSAGNNQALTVDAAETDNYNAASKTVHINVNKAEQTITWADPLDITYGTLLDGTQLNATVEGVSGASAAGTLTYSPAAGTLLSAGNNQALTVDAAETDNYNAATATVHINVNKAEQTITWATPDNITYGTLLSGAQLNAAIAGSATAGASVPGVLTYDPAAGTLLAAGSHTLHVDAAATGNYNAASEEVTLVVDKANPTISVTGGTFAYGDPITVTGSAYGVGGTTDILSPAISLSYTGTSHTGTVNCKLWVQQQLYHSMQELTR